MVAAKRRPQEKIRAWVNDKKADHVLDRHNQGSCFALSRPRVINFKFTLQSDQRYYITEYEEPDFS